MGKNKKDSYDGIPREIVHYIAFVLDEYANFREICIIGDKSAEEEAKEIENTRKLAEKLRKGKTKYLDANFIMGDYLKTIESEMKNNQKFIKYYH